MNRGTSTTILYIDDDADDFLILKEALQSLDRNYEVLQAANGEEGLQKLLSLKEENALPCLIVLDLNMPRLNGRETFERIKADEMLSGIPVVIFSTSSNRHEQAFFQQQNVEYMVKPVQFTLLREAAKRLLNYCTN